MSTVPGPNDWQKAEVIALEPASANILQVTVRPDVWVPFKVGQHLDIRLTAEDGYQASRSYSVASPPEQVGAYDLLIEQLPDGEVSGYFHEGAEVGIHVDIKGPVGGHFVWESPCDGSVLMIAGGSGIAPILSMIRHRCTLADPSPLGLVYATRHAAQLVALPELRSSSETDPDFWFDVFLSRETQTSQHWRNQRIDAEALEQFLNTMPRPVEIVYVCGSNGFAETATAGLVAAGIEPNIIKTERFGGAVA